MDGCACHLADGVAIANGVALFSDMACATLGLDAKLMLRVARQGIPRHVTVGTLKWSVGVSAHPGPQCKGCFVRSTCYFHLCLRISLIDASEGSSTAGTIRLLRRLSGRSAQCPWGRGGTPSFTAVTREHVQHSRDPLFANLLRKPFSVQVNLSAVTLTSVIFFSSPQIMNFVNFGVACSG